MAPLHSMPNSTPLCVEWSKHPRCSQCDQVFGDGRPRVAAVIGLEVASVIHQECSRAFEASTGQKIQAMSPYLGDPIQ